MEKPRYRSNPSTRHIRWEEVIELDTTLPESQRAIAIRALEEAEKNPAQQREFAEALFLQQRAKSQGLTPSPASLPTKAGKDLTIDDLYARRKEPEKAFITLLQESEKESWAYARVANGSGGIQVKDGLLALHLPTLEKTPVPRTDARGKKLLLPNSLQETIAHEFRHTIDELQDRLFTPNSPTTSACKEERAVAAENAYRRASSGPTQSPKRHAYNDIGLYLEASDVKQALLKPVIGAIEQDAGCKGISPEAARKQAIALLKNLNIAADPFSAISAVTESSPPTTTSSTKPLSTSSARAR